jgi:hypothetical protein
LRAKNRKKREKPAIFAQPGDSRKKLQVVTMRRGGSVHGQPLRVVRGLVRVPISRKETRRLSIDLFSNPVGCLASHAVFQATALQNYGFNGSCSETEVPEQLYYSLSADTVVSFIPERGAETAQGIGGVRSSHGVWPLCGQTLGPERVSAEPRKARFFAEQKMRPDTKYAGHQYSTS